MGMFTDYMKKTVMNNRAEEKCLGLEKKRLYATERDLYLKLHMCRDILRDLGDELAERLKLAGADELMKEAAKDADEALKRVYFTVPDDQRRMLDNNSANVTYAIGVRTPGSVGVRHNDGDWGMYLSYADIGVMVGAMKDHCLTCMGSPQEQECCELRKVFDRIGVDAEHVRGECAYRELI